MKLIVKFIGAVILTTIGSASMYSISNNHDEVFGYVGMGLILCLHLAYKYKFNWRTK